MSLYSSADAADGDAVPTQLYTEIKFTVTNVADTTENLNINSEACALTHGTSVTSDLTGSDDLTCAVTVADGTATVTLTHAGLTDSQVETLLDAMTYSNSDHSPTGDPRVITITKLTDNGGTDDSGVAHVVPGSAAATITILSLIHI